MSNTETDSPIRQPRRLRFWLLVVVPLAAIIAGVGVYLLGGRYVSTDDAYVKADLVNVSAEVTGTLVDVEVLENQPVHRDDLLLRIDPASYEVAVQQAQAGLMQARLQVNSLKAGYAQKLAALRSAQADLEFQRSHAQRIRSMHRQGVVSGSVLDEAEHGLNLAQSRIVEVENEIAEVRAQLDGDPDIAVENHPAYRTASAVLHKAQLDLQRTEVRAPIDGIASKVPERGLLAMPGLPLMSVVATQDLWVEANLKESQLEDVRPGQQVQIDVDAYGSSRWQGVVDSIGQATGAEFSLLPPQNASGNWVKVVQRVPVRIHIVPSEAAPPLRAGMSTQVRIDTESSRQATAELPGLLGVAAATAAAP